MPERPHVEESLRISIHTSSTSRLIEDRLEGLTSFEVDSSGNVLLHKILRRADDFRSSYWRSRIEREKKWINLTK